MSTKINLQVVKSCHPGALQDVDKLSKVLSDLYPEQSGAREAICALLRQGFVEQLKSIIANHFGQLPPAELAWLSQTIHEQLALDGDITQQALQSWAQVLVVTSAPSSSKVDLLCIKAQDASLLSDAKRLRSALAEAFPQDDGGSVVICSLLGCGFVEQLSDLAEENGGQVSGAKLVELSQLAQQQLGFDLEAALRGLSQWCRALELEIIEPALPSQMKSPVEQQPQSARPLTLSSLPSSTVPSDWQQLLNRFDWQSLLSRFDLQPFLNRLNLQSEAKTNRPVTACLLLVFLLLVSYYMGWLSSSSLVVQLPNHTSLALIYCEPGSFTMGSPESEFGRCDWEMAPREVTITKGFYLGKYEVTQEQYQAVVGTNPSSSTEDGKCPVENVSWIEARHFCQRLNSTCSDQLSSDYEFSLPTEEQWEYACRAGTKTSLNSGKNLTSSEGACANLDRLAWYGDNSEQKAHRVGEKKANAWGFYDMHGNVWEWCNERYKAAFSGDPLCPSGLLADLIRPLRGGAYNYKARGCRSACRLPFLAHKGEGEGFGFRLAIVSSL